jgi:glycosyltransferase involved in cell wall biosynthesis
MAVHLISSKEGAGGAEKVVAAIGRSAQAHGWRATIVNPFSHTENSEMLRALYWPVPYYQRVTRYGAQLPATRAWTSSLLTNLAPRVVHIHLRHATALAATMRRPPGTVWLLTHHYGSILDHQGRTMASALDRWACRRIGRAVAVSEAVREYLVVRCGLEGDKVSVVPNGWGGQAQQTTLAAAPPTVVCVANFRPEKGHEVLVQAFSKVTRRVADARLVLVGSGPTEANVRAHVRRLGLEESVVFTGTLSDIWPELARADVFALASWFDTFGIAALEAMAAGLPVVTTSVAGLRDIVQHGRTGWLVPPGDQEELAHRLVQLLTDPVLRRSMGQAAREVAATKSEASMADKYYDLYKVLTAPFGLAGAPRP